MGVKGGLLALGSASALAWRNGFAGNPTGQFRRLRDPDRLAEAPMRDERFVVRSCQDVIRGISCRDVARFRLEFLTQAMWVTHVFSNLRKRRRYGIPAITFTEISTRPERLARNRDHAQITNHHGRVGRWSPFHTGGLKDRIAAAVGINP